MCSMLEYRDDMCGVSEYRDDRMKDVGRHVGYQNVSHFPNVCLRPSVLYI